MIEINSNNNRCIASSKLAVVKSAAVKCTVDVVVVAIVVAVFEGSVLRVPG